MELTLRPLDESDLEWARELRNRHRHAFVYQEEISPEQQREWWENYRQADRAEYTLLVLMVDGERAGTTSYRRWYPRHSYELGNNIIDVGFRGKGLFRQVYEQVKAKVGGAPIVATVLDSNQHMLDVYHALGFVDLGREGEHVIVVGDRKERET